MNILGISAYYHDSAACLLRDGEIVAAAQEERFTRKKHDHRFPAAAVAYVLREGGVAINDVDHVVFYDKPFLKFERLLSTAVSYAPAGLPSFLKSMPLWLKEKLHMRTEIARLTGYKGRILFTQHHESHAASAFYPSPFEEAAIVCFDGVGEWATTSYWIGRGNRIEPLKEIRFPHSAECLGRNVVEVGRQRPDFLDLCGRPNQEVLVLKIEPAKRPNNIADIRANAELRRPPDIDGNLHRWNLNTTEYGDVIELRPNLSLSLGPPFRIERKSLAQLEHLAAHLTQHGSVVAVQ